jgi:adenosine deaminase
MEQFIESLPKTETHLHVEGAIPWEFFEERFSGEFPEVPEFRQPEYRYDSFAQFESILIDHALRIIKEPSDYSEIARGIFQKQIEQNVRYVELSFHAGIIEFLQMPGKEIIEAIRSAVPAGLEVRIFMGMSRNSYSDYLGATLEDAVENWEGLHGIDLHGPEDLPVLNWVPRLWQVARANGRTLKAHAGEFGPAENVEWAVQNLGVKRVQHGIHASDEDEVMNLLAGEGVTLDICPISNYKLCIFDRWENYPIRQFLDRGIRCTISTDDPLSFANRLTDEYLALHREMNFSATELAQLARSGFEVADLPEDERVAHLSEIDRLLAVELEEVA